MRWQLCVMKACANINVEENLGFNWNSRRRENHQSWVLHISLMQIFWRDTSPHPENGDPSHPFHKLTAPRCYVRLRQHNLWQWTVIQFIDKRTKAWLTIYAGRSIGKLIISFIDPSQSVSRQESSGCYHHMIVIVESVTLKPGWLFMSADHCPHLTPCSCFLIMAVSQKAQNNQTMSVLNWPANSDV